MTTCEHRATSTSAIILVVLFATSSCVRAGSGASASAQRGPLSRDVDFVQYRWIDTTGPLRTSHFVDPQSGEPLALTDSVWLDISGIDSVWVHHRRRAPDSAFSVLVLHSREASAKVGAATATHVGRRAAVVIDGVVAMVFTVCSALGTQSELASYARRAEADSLAARVDRAARAVRPYRPVYFSRASVRGPAGDTLPPASDRGREYPPPFGCTR